MGTLKFDSEDMGLTEEFLSRAYTRMKIGGAAEHTRAQVSRNSVGSTSVDRLAFDYDMSHDAQPIGKVCLCTVQSGTIVRQYGGGTESLFGPGDAFLYTPHDRPYAGVIQRARYHLIMFDPVLLDQVATALPGRRPDTVRLTGDRPVSPAAAQNLQRTIEHLRDDVLAQPAVRDAPLITSAASQLLAASVLNTFPNNVVTDPGIQDRRDAHPATLRRAVTFIEDHADADISAADIAAAARVSIRALQLTFRRHLGTTPVSYLRRVRLAHAHRDLLAAGPGTDATVTVIAARWGFLHPGRFAADYRRAYGRSPRETLSQLPP
ncbi:AraC family transcriptional regulator [Streptomyces paromomycinus]|uniref:Transcriptional regulator n=1 Tax=Streptomyces paromomycinus TaxID=92743 RepID=A0A401W641_STREY|nr:helix-turn-helix transcriptional regulator [Streptomyces paromomycinus]GCD44731.1 transcriptional regulator [Streptomyces paromomycinus]